VTFATRFLDGSLDKKGGRPQRRTICLGYRARWWGYRWEAGWSSSRFHRWLGARPDAGEWPPRIGKWTGVAMFLRISAPGRVSCPRLQNDSRSGARTGGCTNCNRLFPVASHRGGLDGVRSGHLEPWCLMYLFKRLSLLLFSRQTPFSSISSHARLFCTSLPHVRVLWLTRMNNHHQFIQSCTDFIEYPRNLVHPRTYNHHLEHYQRRLYEERHRLFQPERKAEVDFWELSRNDDRTSRRCSL
jgi:hypothetical protein